MPDPGPDINTVAEHVPDLAYSLGQLPASDTGYSQVQLDASKLPTGYTPQQVHSATLSDQHTSKWVYPGGSGPSAMTYSPDDQVFRFPPQRNDDGELLTLSLDLDNDGDGTIDKRVFTQFNGAPADVNRLHGGVVAVAPAPVVLTTAQQIRDYFDDPDLSGTLNPDDRSGMRNVRIAAGTYSFTQPLAINEPIRVTADPGVQFNFDLSNGWSSYGAIQINSSHVSIEGAPSDLFEIRFSGPAVTWAADTHAVISARQPDGSSEDVELSYLDVVGANETGVFNSQDNCTEHQVALIDSNANGLIQHNTFKGGPLKLGGGPWSIDDNDFTGAFTGLTVTANIMFRYGGHDLSITNNTTTQSPDGYTGRFLLFGSG